MARIKFETAKAFANREPLHDSSNFYSMGYAIYSYRMRLAHWEGDKIVYDYPCRTQYPNGKGRLYSATTNCHMIALEAIVPREAAS